VLFGNQKIYDLILKKLSTQSTSEQSKKLIRRKHIKEAKKLLKTDGDFSIEYKEPIYSYQEYPYIKYVGDGGEYSGYGRQFAILVQEDGKEINLGLTDDPNTNLDTSSYGPKTTKKYLTRPECINVLPVKE